VVVAAVVSAVAWWMLRPAGSPKQKPSPTASARFGCQPVEPTQGSGPATLTTLSWKVSVRDVRLATDLPFEGGETHAEAGKVFVIGSLLFTRLGSHEESVSSDAISIVCQGGSGMSPGYWSQDGEQFCFPCSFDIGTRDPSMTVWFAFKVERQRAAAGFAVDYQGSGPIPLRPPTTP
jgi:hypothetical protein